MSTSAERAIRRLDEVDSTNREAADWARAGAASGSVVVADRQSAGRGRLGRAWFSPKGEGLFLSVVLEPPGPPEAIGLAGLAAAVAVHDALVRRDIEASVKWPNDVLIGEKKVAGILSEALRVPGDRVVAIVGIGVNVAMTKFPAELSDTATSLLITTGTSYDRDGLMEEILLGIDELMISFPEEIIGRYRPICSTIGKSVRIHTASGEFEAVAVAVDDLGGLVLEDGRVVSAGDIIHLR